MENLPFQVCKYAWKKFFSLTYPDYPDQIPYSPIFSLEKKVKKTFLKKISP